MSRRSARIFAIRYIAEAESELGEIARINSECIANGDKEVAAVRQVVGLGDLTGKMSAKIYTYKSSTQ